MLRSVVYLTDDESRGYVKFYWRFRSRKFLAVAVTKKILLAERDYFDSNLMRHATGRVGSTIFWAGTLPPPPIPTVWLSITAHSLIEINYLWQGFPFLARWMVHYGQNVER